MLGRRAPSRYRPALETHHLLFEHRGNARSICSRRAVLRRLQQADRMVTGSAADQWSPARTARQWLFKSLTAREAGADNM